jgi:hypothetical protein
VRARVDAAAEAAASAARDAQNAVRLGEEDRTLAEAASTLDSVQEQERAAAAAAKDAAVALADLEAAVRAAPKGEVATGGTGRPKERISRLRRGREERKEGESVTAFFRRVRGGGLEAAESEPEAPAAAAPSGARPIRRAAAPAAGPEPSRAAAPPPPVTDSADRPRKMSKEERLARLRRGRASTDDAKAEPPKPEVEPDRTGFTAVGEQHRRLRRDDPDVQARVARLRASREPAAPAPPPPAPPGRPSAQPVPERAPSARPDRPRRISDLRRGRKTDGDEP